MMLQYLQDNQFGIVGMGAKKQKKIIIIDAFALIFRAYYALPPLTTKDGTVVNAVYGFFNTLLNVIKDYKPDYFCVAFDEEKPTFRKEAYDLYKAQRKAPPDDFKPQIPIIKQLLDDLAITTYSSPGFEADDVIGTICAKKSVDNKDTISYILTGDLDTLQLVDNNTKVITFKRGMSEITEYDETGVSQKYDGLTPSQLIDMKALKGDQSDNIPGVKGIGEKGAITLIKKFGSLEAMYENIDSNDISESVRKKLLESKDMAFLSKQLVTIVTDAPVDFNLEDCAPRPYNKMAVEKKLHELEFKSLIQKLPPSISDDQNEILPENLLSDESYKLITDEISFQEFLKELREQKEFVFDTETTSLDPFNATLLGIAFSWKEGHAYYVSITNNEGDGLFREVFTHTAWLADLKKVFEDPKVKKIAHNTKYDAEILLQYDIHVQGLEFDTMIAAYLINAGKRSYSLDTLAYDEFGHTMISYEDLVGKGKQQKELIDVELTILSTYACEDADFTYRLFERYQKTLIDEELKILFETIEMPLVPVLISMESHGVLVDTHYLQTLSQEAQIEINSLEKRIYELAGQEFNIASPIQLQEILFETLEIPTTGIARTKTGYSTAASELEKLHDAHPIIPLIGEYRELTKLQSTYLDALPTMVNSKTGRIHTSYNQTITATGRLSSTNPNLQNIPIRKELGKKVRDAFIAEKGYSILAADYSQIELRLTAHYSQDPNLIEIFKKGKDVHTSTAALIHGIPESEVTKEIRSTAKEINFGIIYGLGSVGLAQRTGMTRSEAKIFIEQYLEKFKGIRDYTEQAVRDAQERGYAQTLFGRKRQLPDLASKNNMLKSAAERIAVNMPLQGTAADLIKIAMIKLHEKLPTISPKTKMIMQIHDELVFEVPDEDLEKVAEIVKKLMEEAYSFSVPIVVDVAIGKSWGQAH